MRQRVVLVVTAIVAMLAAIAPVLLAVYLARANGLRAESERALAFAHGVTHRAETVVDRRRHRPPCQLLRRPDHGNQHDDGLRTPGEPHG